MDCAPFRLFYILFLLLVSIEVSEKTNKTILTHFFPYLKKIEKDMNLTDIGSWLRDIQCKLIKGETFLWGLFDVSSYHLCALTIERYIAVIFPLVHHIHVNKFRAKVGTFLVWITGLLTHMIGSSIANSIKDGQCKLYSNFIPNGRKLYGTFLLVVEWIIPISILLISYIHMTWNIHRSRKLNAQNEDKKITARNNLYKTLLVIAIGFLVCNSWNAVVFFLMNMGVRMNKQLFNFTNCKRNDKSIRIYSPV